MSAQRPRLVIGVSGASGPQLGLSLLRSVHALGTLETHLVISRGAQRTIELELEGGVTQFERLADVVHEPADLGAAISSGSFQTVGMAVVPCSMRTLAAIATGNTGDLLTRAADVTLKERRPLVLAAREAPLNLIHIRNMEAATLAGATIVPPVLSFYNRPTSVDEMVDHVVGRILDQLGVAHDLVRRWSGGGGSQPPPPQQER
jgi:polyprenyl P-hydroxybenzoate/phenylacrylic acid decarboxylase-like protein